MANKSKCTPENIELIIDAVKDGLNLKRATRQCGIGYSTARRWLKLGKEKGKRHELYREFLTRYTRERNAYIGRLEKRAGEAALTTRDCILLLERIDPWTWGWARMERAIEKCAEKMADRILSERIGLSKATASDTSGPE